MTWIDLDSDLVEIFDAIREEALSSINHVLGKELQLMRRRESSWGWWRPPMSVSSVPFEMPKARRCAARTCAHCGTLFEPKNDRAKYCKPEHRRLALMQAKRDRQDASYLRQLARDRGPRPRDERAAREGNGRRLRDARRRAA